MLSQQNIKISLKLKPCIYVLFFILIGLFNFKLHAQSQKFKVVLDAGHGGKDPGTLGNASYKKSYESDVALKVALYVGKLLERHSEFKTIYTRKTNIFIPLHKRGNVANKADADLFISIHCNSAVTKAYGTTTYVLGMGKSAKNLELSKRENDVILLEDDYEKHYDYDPNSEEFIIGLTLMQEDYQDKSIEFAQIVQNKFVSVARRKNRGVNQGNLAVLYDSYMPSVLIEIGFLSNKTEEKFLHTKVGQQKIAKAIYEAVKTYKKRIDSNSIETHVTNNSDDVISIDTPDEIYQTNTISESEDLTGSYYKVQFATSRRKIPTEPNNFKKLKNVERIKSGSTYIYSYGKTTSLSEAKKIRKKVVALGYKDAFVKRVTGNIAFGASDIVTTKPQVNTNTTQNIKPTTTTATANLGYYYSVQFATSKKEISIRSYNFKGLKNVVRKKIDGIYKYYYGSTINLDQARLIRKEVVELGYSDAFVKKLKGNIPVKNISNTTLVVKESKPNTNIVEGIVFKVQISSGKRKFETKAYNFRGLENIERVKIGSYYKYYYGKTNDYNLIKKLKKEAVKKGYKDATIVAIKNNKLISINSLLNNSK